MGTRRTRRPRRISRGRPRTDRRTSRAGRAARSWGRLQRRLVRDSRTHVGVTDAARADAQEDFVVRRRRFRDLLELQDCAVGTELGGQHSGGRRRHDGRRKGCAGAVVNAVHDIAGGRFQAAAAGRIDRASHVPLSAQTKCPLEFWYSGHKFKSPKISGSGCLG